MNAKPEQIVPVSEGLWAATLSEDGFCDALGLKKVGDSAGFSLVDPGPRHFFAPAKRASHCFQYVFQVSFECFFFS